MKKRLLSTILVLLLMLTFLPTNTLAVESGNYGSCTWALDGNGVLTISGSGDMYPAAGDESWQRRDLNEFIKAVKIGNGITTVGSDWDAVFRNCKNLTDVSIPNSVTAIGKEAFEGCENLKNITIPNSVTAIGEGAFSGCGLTSVTLPNSISSIGARAFGGCKFKEITLPNSLSSIEDGVFSNTNLESLIIPNSVTSIGDSAFRMCESLSNITIPNSVETIGMEAFFDCKSLKNISIPNSVTSIGDAAFQFCDSLKNVSIPSSVATIGAGAFSLCNTLEEFTVSSDNSHFVSENGVLFDVSKATLLQYPSGKLDSSYSIPNSVTSIGASAFDGCSNLTSVNIPNSVTSIESYAFQTAGLTNIIIPESVTSIGEGAFMACSNLKTVTIPVSVTTIGLLAFAKDPIENVYYNGTIEQWGNINIEVGNVNLTGSVIHCTDGDIPLGFKITLDANGGTVSPESVRTDGVGTMGALPIPNRSGYRFDGWYSKKEGGELASENVRVEEDTTVYAHWTYIGGETPSETYNITFHANDGSGSVTSAQTGRDGKFSSLPAPTRSNYRFDGWYTAETGGEKVTESTVFTADSALYAHWTYIQPVTPPSPTPDNPGSSSNASSGTSSPALRPLPSRTPASTTPAKPSQPTPTPTTPVQQPDNTPAFSDVPAAYWAKDAITWASSNGYMTGASANTFNPDGNITRQAMWMILARLSGENPADMSAARTWAVRQNISDGSSPSGPMTRQQMVTFLYRYAQSKGHTLTGSAPLENFPDNGSVAAYARDALSWAVGTGITAGTKQGTLNPAGTATRAQFAVILQRFCTANP